MQSVHFGQDLNGLACSQGAHVFMALATADVVEGTVRRSIGLPANKVCNTIFDSGSTIAPIRRQPGKPGFIRP